MYSKKNKKFLATALALTLTAGALLTGCGDSAAGTPGSTEDDRQEKNLASDDRINRENAEETPSTDASLPIVDEPATLQVWMPSDVAQMNVCAGDLNNTEFYKQLEERTNVHIEWINPASGTEQESLNLAIASGELPDIIITGSRTVNYIDGYDAAIDDGYYLDLTDLLPQYAPNYMAWLEANGEDFIKACKTDNGRFAFMGAFMRVEQTPFSGYMIRQDWLDELNLDIPVTYEDYENVLTQFKEKKGATAPLFIQPTIDFWGLGIGYGAYGDFYQENGTVYYAPYSNPEGTRSYLETLHKWYENGLLDSDFATATGWTADPVMVNNGNTALFSAMYIQPQSQYAAVLEQGGSFTALQPPKVNADDHLSTYQPKGVYGGAAIISTSCKNPEIAIRWLDYLYSEEGSLFASYGVENDTFIYDENGKPVFTEKITNNENMDFAGALRYYVLAPGQLAGIMDWTRELQMVDEQYCAMCDVWVIDRDKAIPAEAVMNAEENAEYSKIFADIQTYVNEYCTSLVTGTQSFDEFDTFISNLNTYGIERCIELKQSALDRYNSR